MLSRIQRFQHASVIVCCPGCSAPISGQIFSEGQIVYSNPNSLVRAMLASKQSFEVQAAQNRMVS